jgi:hypothetical protein
VAHTQREAPVPIVARDGAFEFPGLLGRPGDTLAAGRDYLFLFENRGSVPHAAQFLRLNDGITPDDLVAAGTDEVARWRLAAPAGGFARVAPGEQQTMVYSLAEPGWYVVLSPGAVAQGMLALFEVTGPSAPFDATRRFDLAPDDTVRLREFAVTVPSGRLRGVLNEGRQPHELQLLMLTEGTTVADLLDHDGDPVAADIAKPAGGVAALAPGMGAVPFVSSLPAGRYALLCTLVDAAGGRRHFELGMVAELTVP